MVVFDLDPGEPATIVECARVALDIREILASLDLELFAKTSGSKGMQLYVPLNTPAHPRARIVVRPRGGPAAREAAARSTVTSMMAKAKRPGKIFVDWSQNSFHKTTIGVYSLRARRAPDGVDAGHAGTRSRTARPARPCRSRPATCWIGSTSWATCSRPPSRWSSSCPPRARHEQPSARMTDLEPLLVVVDGDDGAEVLAVIDAINADRADVRGAGRDERGPGSRCRPLRDRRNRAGAPGGGRCRRLGTRAPPATLDRSHRHVRGRRPHRARSGARSGGAGDHQRHDRTSRPGGAAEHHLATTT